MTEIKDSRTLGAHFFTVSNTLGSPFLLTNLTTFLGIGGVSDLQYAIPSIGDESETKYIKGNLTLALFGLTYQHALKEWLAVYFGFIVNTRMGSDHVTLLKEGINYSSAFNVGWLIEILRTKDLALSGRFQVNNGSYSIISIENFTEDIISGNEDASLITDKYSTTGELNVGASYGISSFLGLNGVFGLGYGESIEDKQSNELFVDASIELDMNFTDMINVPLSVILGYKYNSFPSNSSMLYFDDNIFFGQISYIGRDDFIISLNFALSKDTSDYEGDTILPNSFEINIRYLF